MKPRGELAGHMLELRLQTSGPQWRLIPAVLSGGSGSPRQRQRDKTGSEAAA
jgi:hypothetical protein